MGGGRTGWGVGGLRRALTLNRRDISVSFACAGV